jgi:hypothetical protein
MTTTTTEPAGQLAQPVRRAARYSVCAAKAEDLRKTGHQTLPVFRLRNCASGDAR